MRQDVKCGVILIPSKTHFSVLIKICLNFMSNLECTKN